MHETPDYPLDPRRTVLLIVDAQRAFGEVVPVPGAAEAVDNMRRAAVAWRESGGEVWLTRHAYDDAEKAGRLADFIPGIREALDVSTPSTALYGDLHQEGDRVFRKTRFSALLGTTLLNDLRAASIDTVVAAGLTTPICVQATVDDLSMSDLRVVLLQDACASQALGNLSADQAHRAAVERMGYAFTQRMSTEEFVRQCRETSTPVLTETRS